MRKLIYIMGCAHCGSTLLTRLLAAHDQIATVGELKATAIGDIDNYSCGCGVPILECDFWSQVAGRCRANGLDFDLREFGSHFSSRHGWLHDKLMSTPVRSPRIETIRDRLLQGLPQARRKFGAIARANKLLMDAICAVKEKPVFLDGSKDPVRLRHFLKSGLFDVRAIYLVRDGRAIVGSYKKNRAKKGKPQDFPTSLKGWRTKVEECERAKLLVPDDRVMTLRYEDLCRDVDAQLERICRFVGIEPARTRFDQVDEVQHIIGHNMRLRQIGAVSERTEWPGLLEPGELQRFLVEGHELNALYGYR